MKRALLVLGLCLLAANASAQTNIRPRIGSTGGFHSAAPSISIGSPSAAPTYEVSATGTFAISGSAEDDVAVASVTYTCQRVMAGDCGSGTATGTTSWSIATGITLSTCSASPGTAYTITVTASDGTLTGTDTLVVTCLTPDGLAPIVTIGSPTSSPTYATSTAGISVSGSVTDETSVSSCTLSSATTTPTSRSCTVTGVNNATFSCSSVTQAAGANTVTVTCQDPVGNMGTDVLVSTYTAADVTDPVVTITADLCGQGAGANCTGANRLTSLPITITGTCTDNVACTGVTWSGDTCGSGTAAGLGSWSFDITPGSGTTCVVTVTAVDQAGNDATDTITITYIADLQITTTLMPGGQTTTAYTPVQLAKSGGQDPVTWSNNGAGTTLNDADADCAGLSVSTSGLVTGTPSVSSGTCSWTAKVTDSQGTPDTDTQALTITIVASGLETRNSFWEAMIAARDMCDATHTSNCLLPVAECLTADPTHKGQCSFRSQAEIRALCLIASSSCATASVASITQKRAFNYVYTASDPYSTPQDGAKVIIPGEGYGQSAADECYNQNKTPPWTGCGGIATSEQMILRHDTVTTAGDTLFYSYEGWFGNEWKGGIVGGGGYGTDADCGGLLGSRARWKITRVDTDNGAAAWAFGKINFPQINTKKFFRAGDPATTTDAGWVTCLDNAVGAVGTGLNGQGLSTPTASTCGRASADASCVVTLANLGVTRVDPTVTPSGRRSYFTFESQDYPIRGAKWFRQSGVVTVNVPITHAVLDDWRTDCDPDGTAYAIVSSSVAANTTVTTIKAHGLLVNDVVMIAAHSGSTPELNGIYTVLTVPSSTTFTVNKTITVAGQWGVVLRIKEAGASGATATDAICAAANTTITANNGTLALTKYHVHTTWWSDEEHGPQRLQWRVPGQATNPDNGLAWNYNQFRIELNSSQPACEKCGDAVLYLSNMLIIKNPTTADLDDTGCPSNCPYDQDPVANATSLHRKPRP